MTAAVIAVICWMVFGGAERSIAQQDTEAKLLGHWPMIEDAEDRSLSKLPSLAKGVKFGEVSSLGQARRGAIFDGLTSVVEVTTAEKLNLGAEPFSISLWAFGDENLGDTLGDLISCYDAK